MCGRWSSRVAIEFIAVDRLSISSITWTPSSLGCAHEHCTVNSPGSGNEKGGSLLRILLYIHPLRCFCRLILLAIVAFMGAILNSTIRIYKTVNFLATAPRILWLCQHNNKLVNSFLIWGEWNGAPWQDRNITASSITITISVFTVATISISAIAIVV